MKLLQSKRGNLCGNAKKCTLFTEPLHLGFSNSLKVQGRGSDHPDFDLPSGGVKEGLSCVIFRAIVARKTPNLAIPSLQHSVYLKFGALVQ